MNCVFLFEPTIVRKTNFPRIVVYDMLRIADNDCFHQRVLLLKRSAIELSAFALSDVGRAAFKTMFHESSSYVSFEFIFFCFCTSTHSINSL